MLPEPPSLGLGQRRPEGALAHETRPIQCDPSRGEASRGDRMALALRGLCGVGAWNIGGGAKVTLATLT